MFYKFNNIMGRIAPSTQAAAYSPQGLTPLAREPSVITFDTKKTKPVSEAVVSRAASSTPAAGGQSLGVYPTHPRYKKVIERQNIFLRDDGKLVWQKFARDRGSYYVTVGLMLVGSVALFMQLGKMSFPKKAE